MEYYYTNERNAQMLIYLLKEHGIKKVIASPGTTNACLIASLQQDPFFEIYSCVDERSAAYMACGLSEESGEPVALSCTGATASRNYVSGLTEAYYRKLPVLAITSTQHTRIGHNIPQVIDRSSCQKDIAKMSVYIPMIYSEEDEWAYNVKINEALLELRHRGDGPVHIDLETGYSSNFEVKELPSTRVIRRVCYGDALPALKHKRIGIFVGAHSKWSKELTEAVDAFCELYNAVVLCDHTSNYQGKYGVYLNLVTEQTQNMLQCKYMDLLIHLGNVSGAHMTLSPKDVWRVNIDGVIRDTYRRLSYVFEMEEEAFFESYVSLSAQKSNMSYYIECQEGYNNVLEKVPELPFSNAWIAQQTCSLLPENCVLHLGILNSLRSWNYFNKKKSILGYSNTGGFGIDGNMSATIGASLANPDKLFFAIVGDLAFFYDMNSIGNRHVGKNLRIMVVNNGVGAEFKLYSWCNRFIEDTDEYIAASGHFGRKSLNLIRHYAQDLGFDYISAMNKQEYLEKMNKFVDAKMGERPIIFEVFTNSEDESEALYKIRNASITMSGKVKSMAKAVLSETSIKKIKHILQK